MGITFFGDGASNQGHRAREHEPRRDLDLPVIFVVENNAMRNRPSVDYATGVDSYVDRASGFGLPGVTVDGTDFFAVYEAAGEIIRRRPRRRRPGFARMQDGPLLRHFEGDAQTYKAKGENDFNREKPRLPEALRGRVTGAGVVSDAEIALIDREVPRSSTTPSPGPRPRRCPRPAI